MNLVHRARDELGVTPDQALLSNDGVEDCPQTRWIVDRIQDRTTAGAALRVSTMNESDDGAVSRRCTRLVGRFPEDGQEV